MLQLRTYSRLARLFSTEAVPKATKKARSAKPPREYKIPSDLVEYFATINQQNLLEQFSPKMLRKKHKFPDSYYIASPEAAKLIADYVSKPAASAKVILESNPGPGLLSEHLARSSGTKIHLFESDDNFEKKLQDTYSGQGKRIRIHRGDLVNMWRIGFQDREDNGTRLQELLAGVPSKSWSSKPMRFFAAVGSLNFFKYLIYSIVRQSDIFTHGRFEMFLVVPPPLYIHLTCNAQAGYIMYRANTILFQIMFEYEYLTKIPKKCFLPWQYDHKPEKLKKLTRFYSIDADYLYLVKITPRADIYDLCPLEFMQALLYFVKQNCVSRKHRVIPTLEKWAPGCGPRLIIGTDNPCGVKPLHRNGDHEIPQYSTQCTTMSNKDLYPSMNIFTEFGDLTPSQILTLFTQFRQWPEFKESPFLASLENSLLKMETSEQEATIEGLDLHEEDFVGSEGNTKSSSKRNS